MCIDVILITKLINSSAQLYIVTKIFVHNLFKVYINGFLMRNLFLHYCYRSRCVRKVSPPKDNLFQLCLFL